MYDKHVMYIFTVDSRANNTRFNVEIARTNFIC